MDFGYYILEGHDAVHVDDAIEWGIWLENHKAECGVKQEHIGDFEISTIFLGLDMNHLRLFNPKSRPLLFETMVFSGFQRSGAIVGHERCSTWAEAEAQHERVASAYRRGRNN